MSHTPAQLALEKAMTDSITRMSDTIIELLARVTALEARVTGLERSTRIDVRPAKGVRDGV